jgi:hypothetical protein
MEMTYLQGDIVLPGLDLQEHRANDPGSILVGGSSGDVWAASAEPCPQGILLRDVMLMTTLADLDADEQEYHTHKIIFEAYASIGTESFLPSRNND